VGCSAIRLPDVDPSIETKQTDADAELRRLRARVEDLEAQLRRYERSVGLLRRLADAVTFGPGLAQALRRWDDAYASSDRRLPWRRIPRRETVEVIGAYLRRRSISGLLIALLVAGPTALTVGLLWMQNKKMDQQTRLAIAMQATQLNGELVGLVEALGEAGRTRCLPEDSTVQNAIETGLAPYAVSGRLVESAKFADVKCWHQVADNGALARARWLDVFHNGERIRNSLSSRPLAPAHRFPLLNATRVLDVAADRFNTYRWPLLPADAVVGATLAPKQDLLLRAQSLSERLLPYSRLRESTGSDNDSAPELIEAVSFERATIARAFAATKFSPVGMNFGRAWLQAADLAGVDWQGARLSNSEVRCATFDGGSFRYAALDGLRADGASFRYADLRGARSTDGATFRGASFAGALLPAAQQFRPTALAGADFLGAIVPEVGWLEKVRASTSEPVVAGEPAVAYLLLPEAALPVHFRDDRPKGGQSWVIVLQSEERDPRALATALNDGFTNEHPHRARLHVAELRRQKICASKP
jgi:uncharacterized protein YjbI with pentapeptide repeats